MNSAETKHDTDSHRENIRNDRHLKNLKNAGIPLALISIACLWIGREMDSEALGMVFLITMPLTLLTGLAYNVRYIMLTLQRRKKEAG